MKRIIYGLMAMALLIACNGNGKDTPAENTDAEYEENDSTLYGICGKGTMMHTLELITATNDTLCININDEEDMPTEVCGGLLCGDRMAVTAYKCEGGLTATRIINLTSLIGHWTSIDRKFEICEDGEVNTALKSETNPWTQWRILNGCLMLNADTFDVRLLDADSLYIENSRGIYAFARIKALDNNLQ